MTKPDLRDQALEARPVQGRGAGTAQIIIDDDDLFASPAEPAGAFCQAILEACRFPVLLNLPKGRLADVDDRLAIAVARSDLLRYRQIARRKLRIHVHGWPLDPWPSANRFAVELMAIAADATISAIAERAGAIALSQLRNSRDRKHGFQTIVSINFAAS